MSISLVKNMQNISHISSKVGIMYLQSLRGVIFDLAGTLIDPGCKAPVEAMKMAFSKYGLLVSDNQIRKNMGLGKRQHIIEILQIPEVSLQWSNIYNYSIQTKHIDALHLDTEKRLLEILPQYCIPTPGAVLLTNMFMLHNIKIGITTGYSRATVDPILNNIKSAGIYFDTVVCADEVSRPRPLGGMIYKILQKWQLRNYYPHEILKIGDTIADIQEGRNAKVLTCNVINTSNEIGLNTTEYLALPRESRNYYKSTLIRKWDVNHADFYTNNLEDIILYYKLAKIPNLP